MQQCERLAGLLLFLLTTFPTLNSFLFAFCNPLLRMFKYFLNQWDIIKNVCPWDSSFYFLDHKDFVRLNWSVSFRTNIFISWYSHVINNFEFRIFFITLNNIFTVCTQLNIHRLHFYCCMILWYMLCMCQLFHVHTFWYHSHMLVVFYSSKFW